MKNVKETHFANFVIREFKLTLSPGAGLVDTLHLQDPVPGNHMLSSGVGLVDNLHLQDPVPGNHILSSGVGQVDTLYLAGSCTRSSYS